MLLIDYEVDKPHICKDIKIYWENQIMKGKSVK